MTMPMTVRHYFDADDRGDAEGLAGLFAEDAVVEDEQAVHEGRAAIRLWWANAKAKWQFTSEPLETVYDADKVLVHARVSGNFEGSPITLTHRFTLKSDQIVRLEFH